MESQPSKSRLLLIAFGIVVCISALGALFASGSHSFGSLAINLFISVLLGLICWLFTGAVFAMMGYIFGKQGHPITFLVLTAYALLPWMFLPPLMLLKESGGIGMAVAVLGGFGLWLWNGVLFMAALKFTYSLTVDRLLLAAGIPLLMAFLGFVWVGGFFINLFQMLS